MTQETVRAWEDAELVLVIAWAEDERRGREQKRKQDTIAKIKEMAGAAGISVSIHGKRGRPSHKPEVPTIKAKKV